MDKTIVVAEKMIAAGIDAYLYFDAEDSLSQRCRAVFLAMYAECEQPICPIPASRECCECGCQLVDATRLQDHYQRLICLTPSCSSEYDGMEHIAEKHRTWG